ncbi:MAG: dihydrodipicolinate synthase family protein [Sphingobacteriaceae bacterium]
MKSSVKEFIPVMLTPFTLTGEVDYPALTQLTEFYLEAGAKGLFANCLSSEMYSLDESERLRVVKHIVDTAHATVPVVAAGTFGESITKQADFVKKIYDTGVKAVIVITNKLADQSDKDVVFDERMNQLMDLTGQIPLGFYECPVPYKRIISPAQLKQFVATKRIIYHKDTCMDLEMVKAKLDVSKGYDFGLYDAYMGHAVASLSAGAAGLSCIQGNYWPELIVWLCENFDNTNLKSEVDKVQQFFIDHMAVMHDVYPITAKYYLQKRGLPITTFTRQQVGAFTRETSKKIDDLYDNYVRLQQELNIP